MKNETILVTGGAGFIGSNFIHYIFSKYPDITLINYDALTYAGNLSNLATIKHNDNYTFIQGDIADSQQIQNLFSRFEPDYVVNFAAESHVDRSIENAEIFLLSNVMGVQNLLSVSMDHDLKKFIQISTDEVYGSLGDTGFFTETTPIAPNSPYSASKASADLLARAYFQTYAFPVCVTRCSNNYGPYQYPEKLIPVVITKCLQKEKIPVYGDGQNIRDWLYVDDHCSAIDAVLQKGVPGDVYNIGGNNEITNLQLIQRIIEIVRDISGDMSITSDLISFVEDRKGHDRRYAIDSGKIQSELKWIPAISFELGILKTVQWYLNNNQWTNECLKKT